MFYETEKCTLDLVINIQMNMTHFTRSTPIRQVTLKIPPYYAISSSAEGIDLFSANFKMKTL